MNKNKIEKNLSIKVISKACGISVPSLRMWEKRYQAFSPDRDRAGQRMYSEDDLLRSKALATLLERGHAISHVAKLELKDLRKLLESGGEEPLLSGKLETKKILRLLEIYDLDELFNQLQFQRLNLGVRDFIFKIVLPVLQETGVLVAKGKCSVTQEHIISSLIRDQLSKIVFPSVQGESERFALATPEGNLHELAILIADILCRANKVPTCYLGAAHPADCLGEAVSALKCSVLVMGAISSDQWDYEKNIIEYLSVLDKSLRREIKIILGGGWPLNFPAFKNIKEIKCVANFEDFNQQLSSLREF